MNQLRMIFSLNELNNNIIITLKIINQASARPGTVPSKPILGFNLPTAPKLEKRPKTGGKLLAPPQIDQSISASSSDKESEEMSKEISEITTKHDKDLLNRSDYFKIFVT